jgi:sister-chromatid-cohesion protein PDS5
LRSCQELALSAAVAFETKTAEIIGYIMSEVMLRRSPSEEDLDDRWVEEEELETLDRAKLIGLRVCTHRSLGWARDANALDLVAPTFNLLSQILTNDGQVSDETMEG